METGEDAPRGEPRICTCCGDVVTYCSGLMDYIDSLPDRQAPKDESE